MPHKRASFLPHKRASFLPHKRASFLPLLLLSMLLLTLVAPTQATRDIEAPSWSSTEIPNLDREAQEPQQQSISAWSFAEVWGNKPTKDDKEKQLCHGDAHINRAKDYTLHYWIDGVAAKRVSAAQNYQLYRSSDCTGPSLSNVSIIPFLGQTDPVTGSWAQLHFSPQPPFGKTFVCRTANAKEGPDGQVPSHELGRCLIRLNRPTTWKLGQIIWEFVADVLPSKTLKMITRSGRLDSVVLDMFQWALLVAFFLWMSACAHAIYIFFTLPRAEPPPRLSTVVVFSAPERLMVSGMQMVTMVFGVISLTSLSIEGIFTDVSGWLVDAILFSGTAFGICGVIFLIRSLCVSQLYEIAVLNGRCVKPTTFFSRWNLLVLVLFAVQSGLILVGIFWAQLSLFDLSGAFSGFLGSGKVLHSCFQEHSRHKRALCHTSLEDLALRLNDHHVGASEHVEERRSKASKDAMAKLQAERSAADLEKVDIVDRLSRKCDIGLSVGKFCGLCRQGIDPLDEDNHDIDDTEDYHYTFNFLDVRWHGRYVHSRTGSAIPLLNIPMGTGMLFGFLLAFTRTYVEVRTLAPTLESLSASPGTLVPSFHADVKEYRFLYDEGSKLVDFFTDGNPQMVKRREFAIGEKVVHNETEIARITQVAAEGQVYPFNLHTTVFGGLSGRSTRYNISVSDVRRTAVTLALKSTEKEWARCVYIGASNEVTVTVPRTLTKFDLEVFSIDYVMNIPYSYEEYETLKERVVSFDHMITVQAPLGRRPDCSALCWDTDGCLEWHQSTLGYCLLGIFLRGDKSCWEIHNRGRELEPNSVLSSYRAEHPVQAHYCTGECSPLKKGKLAEMTPENAKTQGVSLDRGHSFLNGVELDTKHVETEIRLLYSLPVDTFRSINLQMYSFNVVRGAPVPAATVAIGPPGIAWVVTYDSKDMYRTRITLHDVPVETLDLRFPLHVTPILADPGFEVKILPEFESAEPPSFEKFHKKCQKAMNYRGLRSEKYCFGAELPATATVEVDKFDPRALIHIGSVQLKEEEKALGVEPRQLFVQILTVNGEEPAAWAMERSCKLDLAGFGLLSSRSMLSSAVVRAAVSSCSNVTILHEDDERKSIKTKMDIDRFFDMAIRLHPQSAPGVLMAYVTNPIFKERGWQKQIWVTGAGIEFSGGNSTVDAVCGFIPDLVPRLYTAISVPWEAILEHRNSTAVVETICAFGDFEFSSPKLITMLTTIFDEDAVAEVLNCLKYHTGVEASTEEKSKIAVNPAVIAVRRGFGRVLKSIINIDPSWLLLSEFTQDDWWGLALRNGCIECVSTIAEAIGPCLHPNEVPFSGRDLEDLWSTDQAAPQTRTQTGRTRPRAVAHRRPGEEAPPPQEACSWYNRATASEQNRVKKLWSWVQLTKGFSGSTATSEAMAEVMVRISNATAMLGMQEGVQAFVFEDTDLSPPGRFLRLLEATEHMKNMTSVKMRRNKLPVEPEVDHSDDDKNKHKKRGRSRDDRRSVKKNRRTTEGLSLLNNFRHLEELELSDMVIGEGAFENLADGISGLKRLHTLRLENLTLDADQIDVLASVLKKSHLDHLVLKSNPIGIEGLVALCKAKLLQKVSVLDIADIGLEPHDDYQRLASKCRSLDVRELNISHNNLGNDGLGNLTQLLSKNSRLQVLDLTDTHLQTENFPSNVASLGRRKDLILHLDDNAVGARVPAILGAFKYPPIRLFLRNTSLSDADASALGGLFESSKSLQESVIELDIGHNPLTHIGLLDLLKKAEKLTELRVLSVRYTDFGGLQDSHGIFKAIRRLRKIETIDVSGNRVPLRMLDSVHLSQVITLVMHDVIVDYSDFFADSTYFFLKHMKKLETLDLSGNNISSHGLRRMIDQLCKSSAPPKLRSLNLAGSTIHSGDLKICKTRVEETHALQDLRELTTDMNQCGLAISRNLFPKVTFLREHGAPRFEGGNDQVDYYTDDCSAQNPC